MSDVISFTLDGKPAQAEPGESIFQVAKRLGIAIPHMCSGLNQHYRADGNCRLCLVEIDGERTLAASCKRLPSEGMTVSSASARTTKARNMVMELLIADQPTRATGPDPQSRFWQMADQMGLTESRFGCRPQPDPDTSHPAISVNMDACIQCTNCVRACREIQVNDVIGMARRGARSEIVFDIADPMGTSTCVACGECVQACPTGALLEKSPPLNVDREVRSLCPYCGVGCQVAYKVADDRIVGMAGRNGPGNLNRLCVKGRFGLDYVHHPHRLTTPLIRRDDAPKVPDPQFDAGDWSKIFREATWAEALDLAASGLKSIRQIRGDKALAGFGSAKGSNEEAYLVQKLVRTGFGSNNVDHCTRLCHASSVAALMEGIGSGAVTAPFTAAKDADVIIVIGSRPAQNHPVAATFIKNAKQDGATLIVMDPRGQGLTRHADHMLQFKPGMDVALLNAILHVIIEEGLTDADYIARHTEGFDNLKQHIKGFSPEKMAPLCGIDADVIRTVARTYASAERAIIYWGMGISQHVHGTDNARCLIALALVTGNVGRPGTGLHPLRGQNNVQGASDVGLIPMVYPDYKSVTDADVRARYEELWGMELDPEPGLTVVEIINAIHAGTINGMYIMGENPAMSDPDVAHARAAFSKLDHLVVQDIFLTETAHFADVVLPASAFPEKFGTFTNSNRQVQMARQVLEPPGEARQDWWIIQEIAHRMGLDWAYRGPQDVFAEMRQTMASIKGITWQRLENENHVTYPCASEEEPGKEILFGDGFPTANGRARLVPAQVEPPDELPDDDYPTILTTGRMLEHWHTGVMTRHAAVLSAIEPEAVVNLHPRAIAGLGMEPGDMASVTSRRGSITLKTRADRDVPENMAFIPFCFNEAAANLLTNPSLDPYGKIPEFKFAAVRVKKASS
ncbi:MAG: formate dehydrogenase subunit alpha [Rhodospirillales bacterium]|nr:formate dehydrogenase subunit alpha [Rhodospirillales bacterium]